MKLFEDIKIKPLSWARAGVYTLLIILLYNSTLKWLIFHDWYMEEFSHCVIVPFITIYLIWEKRKDLVAMPSVPSWWGVIPLCVGIVFYWLGELGGEVFTLYMSIWLVIAGIVWLNFGLQKLKKLWFAFVMMFAMFPPPNFVIVRTTSELKLVSSQLGVWMLHFCGVSAYREGNVIDIGFTKLQIVDACSGLNYVAPLAVLGLLFAYWFRAHPWKRIFLFLSSVPLAIFVNSFRIAMTGILYGFAGPQVAEGFFHLFSGWLIFLFAIPLLIVEMFVLRMFPPREPVRKPKVVGHAREETIPRSQIPDPTNGEVQHDKNEETAKAGWGKEIFQTRFLVIVIALFCVVALSHTIDFRGNIPARRSFDQFPMIVGGWRGVRGDMDQRFIEALKFSDYITVNYYDRQGKIVNFYVAYYRDQRKGASIHSPATCLPGSGWEFHELGVNIVPATVAGVPPIRAKRAFMEKEGISEIVYYWFPMRGRVATRLYQIKLYNFWDALTKHRTDGALVRVITPVYPAEHPQDTELRLQRFVADIGPVLKEFLPD